MIASTFSFSGTDSLLIEAEKRHLWSGLSWDAPMVVVSDVPKAIHLYETVLGFIRIFVLPDEHNSINFARMRYRGTYFTIMQGEGIMDKSNHYTADETTPTNTFYLYVDNVERVYLNALASGWRSLQSPHNNFSGDRKAGLIDTFGYIWDIAARL